MATKRCKRCGECCRSVVCGIGAIVYGPDARDEAIIAQLSEAAKRRVFDQEAARLIGVGTALIHGNNGQWCYRPNGLVTVGHADTPTAAILGEEASNGE